MKNLKPITRHEQFLQDIADGEVDLKPITRQEYFLAKIAESGGGGGSSLPSYTSSDVGKVLTVGEDGETVAPVWQTVGGLPIIGIRPTETAGNHADFEIVANGAPITTLQDATDFITEHPHVIITGVSTVSEGTVYATIIPFAANVSADTAMYRASQLDQVMTIGYTSIS